MKNIELKIILPDSRNVLVVLKKIRAKSEGKLLQVDTYYNCKNGRLKLREINGKKSELIFYKRPDKSGSKVSNYEVIKFDKKRIKQMRFVLRSALGEKVIVNKIRNLWIYKNTRIHLDKVTGLGNFLELETVVDGINMKQSREEHEEVVGLLSLEKNKKIEGSYSDLLLKKK